MTEESFHQPPEAPAPKAKWDLQIAPLLPRFSAFCADMCVIILLFITILYVFLPRIYPTESEALRDYQQEVAEHNVAVRQANQAGQEPPPAPEPSDEVLRYGNILHITFLSILFLYFFLGEKFTGGSSPGKMLFRLKVVLREAPERPLPGIVSALRSMVKSSFFILPPLMILFAFVFFQAQKRGLHDLLARTLLVRFIPNQNWGTAEDPPESPEPPTGAT